VPTGRERVVRAIVLVGFMGAGKTSVGRALSQRLGWEFEDLDDRIERREGRSVPEIFRDAGEFAFRQAESAALSDFLQELSEGAERVLALGGGAFAQERNVNLLKSGAVVTVFLDVEAEQAWQRCQQQAGQQEIERPLLGNQQSFRKLFEARRPFYLQADFRHDTTGKTVEQVAAEIVQSSRLKKRQAGGGETQ